MTNEELAAAVAEARSQARLLSDRSGMTWAPTIVQLADGLDEAVRLMERWQGLSDRYVAPIYVETRAFLAKVRP